MTSTAVHLNLQHAHPTSERLIVCDDELNLAEFAQVIDAAFDLTGEARCLFVRPPKPPVFTESVVYTAFPDAESGEKPLAQTSLAEAFGQLRRPLDYHYGHSTDWVISVQSIGEIPNDQEPTPRLVHGTGPDTAEGLESPRIMSTIRDSLMAELAGVPDAIERRQFIAPGLNDVEPLPLLERLSFCDELAAGERVATCLNWRRR